MKSNVGKLKFDLHQSYNHDQNNITLDISEDPHECSDSLTSLMGKTFNKSLLYLFPLNTSILLPLTMNIRGRNGINPQYRAGKNRG